MFKNGITTQAKLANKLSMSENQISNILSDRFNPIKSTIIRLSSILNVEPSKIIKNKKHIKDKT